MSDQYPELVFVAGPQKGQRVRLGQPVCVFGRGAGVDVMLSEEFISRQQFRYESLRAGPTIENLSRRGTWICGKRYRGGQKILMASGDVIAVGAETQILFVAAGDDPKEIVQAWRQSPPGARDAFGRRVRPAAAPAPAPSDEPAQPGELPAGEAEKRPSEMNAEERDEMERKAKRRKLLIGLGSYWALLMLVAVVVYLFWDHNVTTGVGRQTILTEEEIAEHLKTITPRMPNRDKSAEMLIEARNRYRSYSTRPGRLHEIVGAYKDAMAYSGRDYLPDEHDRIFAECMDALIERVRQDYGRACLFEKREDWAESAATFRSVVKIVGDPRNPISRNIAGHLKRVNHYHKASKPRSKSF